MIRWLCGHISPTAPSRRYSRCGDRPVVRPDGNNVGGPSHAVVHGRDCTTASRSNSPNYKIIILRLAPPGNTRDQIRSPLSSLGLIRPYSPRAFTSAHLSLLILFLSTAASLPSSSYLSGSRRSSLIVRRDEDARALTSLMRQNDFKRSERVSFNLAFSPRGKNNGALIPSMPRLKILVSREFFFFKWLINH